MSTRTSCIDALRGFCSEFGIVIAEGSRLGVEQISRTLADPHAAVPTLIRRTMTLLVEEIRLLEVRIAQLERELTALARQSPACAISGGSPSAAIATCACCSPMARARYCAVLPPRPSSAKRVDSRSRVRISP